MNKFWIVASPDHQAISRYDSRAQAEISAGVLAAATPGKLFIVFEAISQTSAKAMPVSIEFFH